MLFWWLVLLLLPRLQSALLPQNESFTPVCEQIKSSLDHAEAIAFLRDAFVEQEASPSLEDLRDQAYAALLSEHRKVLKSCNEINWNWVEVQGWPREVLFYSRAYWRKVDCFSLMRAVEGGKISFQIKTSKPENKIDWRRKRDLKEKALRVSKELFSCDHVDWRGIKQHCPDLHLISGDIQRFNYDDYVKLDAALNSLTAKCNATEISSVETETRQLTGKSTNLQVYAQLLAKYRELAPMDTAINWSMVNVIGWPESVIFYAQDCWSEEDCQSLLQSIPGIRFVYVSVPHYKLESADRVKLQRRIEHFFCKFFKSEQPNWPLIAALMPGFHLTNAMASKWTQRDVKAVEEMFKYFEENFANPMQRIIKRKLNETDFSEVDSSEIYK